MFALSCWCTRDLISMSKCTVCVCWTDCVWLDFMSLDLYVWRVCVRMLAVAFRSQHFCETWCTAVLKFLLFRVLKGQRQNNVIEILPFSLCVYSPPLTCSDVSFPPRTFKCIHLFLQHAAHTALLAGPQDPPWHPLHCWNRPPQVLTGSTNERVELNIRIYESLVYFLSVEVLISEPQMMNDQILSTWFL